ncbi:tetratricopeptide repeat protein [Aurantibacillus circumpalustris]|uniref:tetratricopeptide repeat protein n=1 Tax=Aurantibacillus circumpalustris TaxID=3036359 RepID=UPI00295AFFC5|nr:tetratricopeptide repeat protein [Aurantibacillus circumpalustris]
MGIKDSSIAKILNALCNAYRDNNPDKALDYGTQAVALSEKIVWKKGIALAYNSIGIVYKNQDNYPEALKNYFASLKIKEEIGDKKGIAGSYNNIGTIYMARGNYPEALKMYLSALKINEETGNKNWLLINYRNIGQIYHKQGNNSEALKNYFVALKIAEELGDKNQIAGSNEYIAGAYMDQGNYTEALKKYFSVLEVVEETGKKNSIVSCYGNIALIYALQHNYLEALKITFAALKVSEDIGAKAHIAASYINIGTYYLQMNRAKEGKTWLQKGLTLSRALGRSDDIMENYKNLAEADSALGNYRGAFENYKLYILYRDSIFNNENTKKLTQTEMQFEFDKKEALTKAEQEKKDALALEEIEKQKLVRNGFIGGFTVVLLFAGVFFRQRNKIKQGNRELQIAKERAEKSERLEQQFLANMSHEIRTPMNAVMGMTNLVLDSPLNPKQKFYLDIIKKSADNLLYIINDILDLSKIEAGKLDVEKIDFSIETVSKQVMQTLQHKAEEKGLELVLNLDSALPAVVLGDPVRLNQILMNLAGNAIKFTEKGSVAIEVKKNASEIKFSIIDTGIGIPKDKLQTVFESFSQANSSDTRKYGGTGLGLTISRQLVELMGGKINIESKEGSGTTFWFSMPFEEGSEAGLKQRLAKEENVDGSILDALNILVVDDNEYNRIVAKDTLESKSKAKVTAVDSAKEAIKLLQQKTFDVVLMDVQMPDMNGFEATQYIRTKLDAPLNTIPIVALTASVLRADLDKCTAAGMNSYIPKPFKTSQLIAGIAQVLNIELVISKETQSETNKPETRNSQITNLDYLHKFCEGDKTKMKKYIGLYTSAAPTLISNINDALKKNNLEELANQIHGFKTKWIMMGMTETKNLAMEIENQCREGKSDEKLFSNINELVSQIRTSISELS